MIQALQKRHQIQIAKSKINELKEQYKMMETNKRNENLIIHV